MTSVAVFNPAGGSAVDHDELASRLPGVDIVETRPDAPGTSQADEAVAGGATTVIACGGDGTVRAVLEALVGSEAALDIVPLGTGNLLARNLGIPAGVEAADDAGRRPTHRIDTGRVNGEAFAVMAGSGFDARMMRDADSDSKDRWGVLAYVLAGARHLRDSLVPTEVKIDGHSWFVGRTGLVLVGNCGEMTGGIEVFPDASATDGRLDVAVLRAQSLRDWARVLWRLVRGRDHPPELVQRTTGESIVIETSRPRPYQLDGEVREPAASLHVQVVPASLLVHAEAAPGATP